MNIDTDRVIKEVQSRPALWDSTHELYKERDVKTKTWLEVCRVVIPNFDTISDVERKLIEKQVQERWKTARNAYVRSKTPGSESTKRKKYIYFDALHFLDKNGVETIDLNSDNQSVASIQTQSGPVFQHLTEDSGASVTSSNNEASTAIPSLSHVTNRRHNFKLRKILKSQKKCKAFEKDDADMKKELLKLFKYNLTQMKDDDMAFFTSLLPFTRDFDKYQKLVFRSEVLRKAMEVTACELIEEPVEISFRGASNNRDRQFANFFAKYASSR